MKVLMAAAECSPYARTGGLGEVLAGLSKAVAAAGHDVTVVIPRYRHIQDLGEARSVGGHVVHEFDADGVTMWLFDDPDAFNREGIYGPTPGSGYDDQWLRFGRFSRAAAELAQDFDLLHLHDSHVGPATLISPIPTVFTIHNAAYSIFGELEEVADELGLLPADRVLGGPIEWYGQAHFLKAGIDRAHAVTTVSPTFARQLLADPSISNGLDVVLAARDTPVTGILNGIDDEAWDPRTDAELPEAFTRGRLGGRIMAKGALLARSGLDSDGMLLGAVTRVTEQKGIGLLDPDIDTLVAEGFRFFIVGNGELDGLVDTWMARHPTAIWHEPYSEPLARLVSAGVDAYLMPSRFEPCGLGQMYAMRYGAPPIVHLTGGLADTVIDLDEQPDAATGFGFRSFESAELTKTLRRARRVFEKHRADWRRLQRNGMGTDFSWDRAAARYLDVYRSVWSGTAG